MRPLNLAPFILLPLTIASDISHWSTLASRSKTGVIKLDTESYEQLLSSDRDYSVSVVLTALPAQFKCQPCQSVTSSTLYSFNGCRLRGKAADDAADSEFDPHFHRVAGSWKRQPQHIRDQHFFAQLDFSDGQPVYQKVRPDRPAQTKLIKSLARPYVCTDCAVPPSPYRSEQVQQAQRDNL